jgi:hypothetical protein
VAGTQQPLRDRSGGYTSDHPRRYQIQPPKFASRDCKNVFLVPCSFLGTGVCSFFDSIHKKDWTRAQFHCIKISTERIPVGQV